jgi:large subunit ribosomal protein L10
MPTKEKVQQVAELKELFGSASSYFITDYQGLNVEDITLLRKSLRDNQVKYLVAKNTLFCRALEESGIEGLGEHFIGPTAIAFTAEDPAVAAKILHDSYKDKELPRMKVFVVDEQVFAAEDIKRLASLPPRELLLSGLVAAVEAPFTSLIGSLDGFFRGLVGSIDALAEKRKEEEA